MKCQLCGQVHSGPWCPVPEKPVTNSGTNGTNIPETGLTSPKTGLTGGTNTGTNKETLRKRAWRAKNKQSYNDYMRSYMGKKRVSNVK